MNQKSCISNTQFQYAVLMLLFLVFTNFSCKKLKEEPTLPPATQTGENKMGCLIDGEVWEPWGFPAGYPLYAGNTSYHDGRWIISGDKKRPEWGNVNIHICKDAVTKGGSGFNFFYDEGACSVAMYSNANGGISYFTKPGGYGEVIITRLDTSERIISGTFYFDAYEVEYTEEGSKFTDRKVEIRDGRFDIKFKEKYFNPE
jgi:hypothetical protein